MIETILQHTETLQELLDRRGRLLQDLHHINKEIEAAYLIVMGSTPAVPPLAAPENGTPRRGRPPGKTPQKALAAPNPGSKAGKANAKSEKAPKRKNSPAREAVLGVLRSHPLQNFTAREMAEMLEWERPRAANTLNHLYESKGVLKVRPGVFRHKK